MVAVGGPATSLRDTLERAVERGLISEEQAAAILASETPLPAEAAAPRSRVRAVTAEVLGYVGAALATASAIIVVSEFWAQLRPGARVALVGVVALALLAAGAPLGARDRPAIARLGSFLWGLSAAAFAFTVFLLGSEILALRDEHTTLLTAWSTTGYAAVLWWRRRRALQQVATFAALVVGTVEALLLVDPSLEPWVGFAVWALGLAWLVLAWAGLTPPLVVGYAVGAVVALVGPSAASVTDLGWELLLGLATAAGLVVASVVLRRTVLLALGVVGLFVYIPRVVFAFFGDQLGAPVALLVTGVLLIGGALLLARVRPVERPGADVDRSDSAEARP